MNDEPDFCRLWFYIIQEADCGDKGKPGNKPRITKPLCEKIRQCPKIKYNASTTECYFCMRTSLIGFIYYIEFICNFEINQFEQKKKYCYKQVFDCFHQLHYFKIFQHIQWSPACLRFDFFIAESERLRDLIQFEAIYRGSAAE